MRFSYAAVMLALIPAPSRATDDISLVAIGLPFAPETPKPVQPSHPLFHHIGIDDIKDLPAAVGSSALAVYAAAKRSSINAALRDSFARMNMLAVEPGAVRARLMVSWQGSRIPFRIASHNEATAALHYRLVRSDIGQVIFDRDIHTSVKGHGGGGWYRDNGILRAAIAANFASAANCLDRAAFGDAPGDCALTPRFSVETTIVRRP